MYSARWLCSSRSGPLKISSGMIKTRQEIELIVLGAPRKRHEPFGSTVEHVLRKADCRVLMIGAAPLNERVNAAA